MCSQCNHGMVTIDEGILDTLIIKSGVKPEDLKSIRTKASPESESTGWPHGSKNFYNLIDSLMNQQITITQKHIEQAELADLARIDFLEKFYPEMDWVIYSKADDIAGYVKSFYDIGKEQGYKELAVDAFTGNADTHALYTLTHYNFGLVKNLDNDLREQIRQTIWQGVANNYDVVTIGENLKEIPIQPLQIGNRTLTPEYRAQMIAKTEAVRANNQGLYMTFKEYGITHVSVFGGGNPCDDCQAIIEESPYPIDEVPDGGIPFHPWCECTLLPEEDPADEPTDPESYLNFATCEMTAVPEEMITII